MDIVSSAPNKIIITGEHSVVHGSYAIAVPISLRNKIHLTVKDASGAEPYFHIEGTEGWSARVYAGGKVEGTAAKEFSGFVSLVQKIFLQNETSLFRQDKIFNARIISSNSPKGTGNSASIAAALAMAVHAYFNQKPTSDELFEETYSAEKVIYPTDSGIDSRTVSSNKTWKLRKIFNQDGTSEFEFSEIPLSLPGGTSLLIIDTLMPGQRPVMASYLVQQFAHTYFKKLPAELTLEEKNKIVELFNPVIEEIEKELCPDGDPAKLGKLFLKNHELLKQGGVVPKQIDEIIEFCMKNRCYGAKVTGYGGAGGTIIALASSEKVEQVRTAIHASGLRNIFEVHVADTGPIIESVMIDEKDERKDSK